MRSSRPSWKLLNLRIVIAGPRIAAGGMTALKRLPSGRRASTIGLDSSTLRPTVAAIRRITFSIWLTSSNFTRLRSILPSRSM